MTVNPTFVDFGNRNQTFVETHHGLERMAERDISRKEVSSALKHGFRRQIRNSFGRLCVTYKDLVVILAERDLVSFDRAARGAEENMILIENPDAPQRTSGVQKIIVTVYRDNSCRTRPNLEACMETWTELSGAEYETWNCILRCICTSDLDNRHSALIDLLELGEREHGGERLADILNWTISKDLQIHLPFLVRLPLLSHAAYRGDHESVRILLGYNCRANILDQYPTKLQPPLHYALTSTNDSLSCEDQRLVVTLLVEHLTKEDINTFACGYTALHRALYLRDIDICRLLLRKGANPSIINKYQEDCFVMARRDLPELVDELQQGTEALPVDTPDLQIASDPPNLTDPGRMEDPI